MKWLHVLTLKCLDLIKAKTHVKAHFRRHANGSLVFVKDFDTTRHHADHVIEAGKTYKINNHKSIHHGKHAKVIGYMPETDKKKHYVTAMVDGKRSDLKPEHFEHIDGGWIPHGKVIRRTPVVAPTPAAVPIPVIIPPAPATTTKRPPPTAILGKRPDAPFVLDPKDVLANEYSFSDILEGWQKDNQDLKVKQIIPDGATTRYIFQNTTTMRNAGWIQVSTLAKRPHKVFFTPGEKDLAVAELYKKLCRGWRNENGGRLDIKAAFGDIGIRVSTDSSGVVLLTGSTFVFRDEIQKWADFDRTTKQYKMKNPTKLIDLLGALPPYYTKEELHEKTAGDDTDTIRPGAIDPLIHATPIGDGGSSPGTPDGGRSTTGHPGGPGTLPTHGSGPVAPSGKKLKDYTIKELVELIHIKGVKAPDPHITLDPKIVKKLTLFDHQIDGSQAIVSSFDRGDKGFLLGDDVGTGKTYTGAAVLAQMKPKRAIICVPNDGVRQQWIEVLKKVGIDAISAEGTKTDFSKTKGVMICTDTTLGANPTLHDAPCDLFMLDEAHRMKNLAESSKTSSRAEAALKLVQHNMVSGGKTLYMTATPYEKPWQAQIYEALEMWEPGEFDKWLLKHGVDVSISRSKDPITGLTNIKRSFGLVGNGKQAVKRTLISHIRNIASGKSLSREVLPEGVSLANHFHKTELDADTKKQYGTVMDFFRDAALAAKGSKNAMFIGGQRTLWARRFLEAAKLPMAIKVAKNELYEGRKVCIMTGYKNKADIMSFADKVIAKVTNMNPGAVTTFRNNMKALGDKISGTFDVLEAEFPNAVLYHGGIGKKVKEKAKDAYNNGTANVLIATQASADTGISLHDTVGDSPRSQINLTIPWSAIQMKQLAGRSHRLGTKSDTRMHWLFGDDEDEQNRAMLVSKKMEIMGASSAGIDVSDTNDLYKRLVDFDMATGTGIKDDGFRPKVMKKSFVFRYIVTLKK